MSGKPKLRARHKRRWTREEEALLRREWGELGGRELCARLGRSAKAIVAHALLLGLPAQGSGTTPVYAMARRLGCAPQTLCVFAAECGLRLERRARVARQPSRQPHRVCDADQIEVLYTQRTTRAVTLAAWDRARGVGGGSASRTLRDAGIPTAPKRAMTVRVPDTLLDELAAGVVGGPWCELWRRVLATQDRPCAPWLLALAAWDIREAAAGRGDAEWTELWLPCAARAAARELAGVVVRRAGPALRSAAAERGEERAA